MLLLVDEFFLMIGLILVKLIDSVSFFMVGVEL